MSYSFTEKKRIRKSFASRPSVLEVPSLLDTQLRSYEEFLQADVAPNKRNTEYGLQAAFTSIFPITSHNGYARLRFVDYELAEPEFDVAECQLRGLTFCSRLRAKIQLEIFDRDAAKPETLKEIRENDVYMGEIPLMTEKGSFIINGTERVIVSQLHRSPGVFFGQSMHTNGTKLYSARIIPFKGSWIEFATDINNVMYAYIDRKKKLPVTTLLRAIGFEADQQILEIFDLADEVKVTKAALKKAVGRKLAARVLSTWVEDFVDEDTGEVVSIERNNVIVDRETVLQEEHIDQIIESGAKTILLHKENLSGIDFSIICLLYTSPSPRDCS